MHKRNKLFKTTVRVYGYVLAPAAEHTIRPATHRSAVLSRCARSRRKRVRDSPGGRSSLGCRPVETQFQSARQYIDEPRPAASELHSTRISTTTVPPVPTDFQILVEETRSGTDQRRSNEPSSQERRGVRWKRRTTTRITKHRNNNNWNPS